MVDTSYMLGRDPRPSPATRWIDRRLIPATINAVAPVEQALYRVSDEARARPTVALLLALAFGFAARILLTPQAARAAKLR